MLVERIMNRPVITCDAIDSAQIAAGLMWDHDCGVIPVLDRSGHLVGVVTDRDLCMAALLRGQRLAQIPVAEIMTRRVVTCRPENTLDYAEKLMRERQIHRLPVIDADDRLVGLASISDIARESMQDSSSRQRVAVTKTLAEICRPRTALATGGQPPVPTA